MALTPILVTVLVFASNPAHALDLKKELCTYCGYNEDADAVDNMWDCLTCEEGFEIVPMFDDCTGLCVKSGRSVRTFKQMGFADLATSACTAYLDCYGGDDRKGVKVLPADDDDFFDDDLYEVLGRD